VRILQKPQWRLTTIRRGRDWTGVGWRLELITTITRVKRVPLLALFFVSAMEFALERALINLVLMSGALTILLWAGCGSRDTSICLPENAPTLPRRRDASAQKAF